MIRSKAQIARMVRNLATTLATRNASDFHGTAIAQVESVGKALTGIAVCRRRLPI